MDLNQVRVSINDIDSSMKKLFDKRFLCTNQVAAIKINEQDNVFKPLREKEIVERFAGEYEYITFIKKIMQISRKRQYGIFLEKVESLSESMCSVSEDIASNGQLRLDLKADKTSTMGLNVNDILSVISDTSLVIKTLNVDEDGTIKVILEVDVTDENKMTEALVLAYMLSEETIK